MNLLEWCVTVRNGGKDGRSTEMDFTVKSWIIIECWRDDSELCEKPRAVVVEGETEIFDLSAQYRLKFDVHTVSVEFSLYLMLKIYFIRLFISFCCLFNHFFVRKRCINTTYQNCQAKNQYIKQGRHQNLTLLTIKWALRLNDPS